MGDRSAVIIGVGEASERIDAPDYEALSPADLAGRAAAAALADAGAGRDLAPHVQWLASVRQFETSHPRAVAPFGKSDNFPRAVARRIGAEPANAVIEPIGGQGPQHLANEMADRIAKGELDLALICGAEAISTVRHFASRGETRDWSETVGGQVEDRGFGELDIDPPLFALGARTPINVYALFENARRARLGLDRQAYRREMGKLFAPFTDVAAGNPHAMSKTRYDAEALAEVTAANRLTSDPFPRRVVARDQANQGAAVLIASEEKARALGVAQERWVYLHAGVDVKERPPLERQDLSRSPAAVRALQAVLAQAGLTTQDITLFDLYSCFPIAVFNARDGLGISPDDPRPLTVTGGLPFFGGAGNNYSMHAIASMVRALRAAPGAYGLVAANGGYLSKYSVGIYSTRPSDWPGLTSKAVQAEIDAWPAPQVVHGEGEGVVETYTIDYAKDPPRAFVVARRESDGARLVGVAEGEANDVVQSLIDHDPLGGRVSVRVDSEGRSRVSAFQARVEGR